MKKSILVVEDSWLLAELIIEELRHIGVAMVGPVANLEEALRIASSAPLEGALLDIELQGRSIFPVCEVLERRDIPFAFVSGRNRDRLPERWQGRRSLTKPFTPRDLRAVVSGMLDAGRLLPDVPPNKMTDTLDAI
jgi:DNA-binding response OmpR family regulator